MNFLLFIYLYSKKIDLNKLELNKFNLNKF